MRISALFWLPGVLGLCVMFGCSRNGTENTGAASSDAPAAGTQSMPAPTPESTGTTAGGSDSPAETTAAATEAAAGAAPAAGSGSGAQVYQQYCVTCHGPQGKGDGPAAAGLNPKPASFAAGGFRLDPNGNGTKGEVEDIKAVVRDGAAKYGGSPLMAPWPMLSAEQLQAVSEHVKSLGG